MAAKWFGTVGTGGVLMQSRKIVNLYTLCKSIMMFFLTSTHVGNTTKMCMWLFNKDKIF